MDSTQDSTGTEDAQESRTGPFGGLDASEAGKRSAEARRQRRANRDAAVDEARLTARQRLGLAMSELTLEDIRAVRDGLLRKAKTGDEKAVHALARLLDQSFGRAQPHEDEGGTELEAWESMSAGERATARARWLRELEEDGRPAGDSSDPRADETDLSV